MLNHPEDAILIDAYTQVGVHVDALAYTPYMSTLIKLTGKDEKDQVNYRNVYLRLQQLNRHGLLPRVK